MASVFLLHYEILERANDDYWQSDRMPCIDPFRCMVRDSNDVAMVARRLALNGLLAGARLSPVASGASAFSTRFAFE
jgi:hypothetical protein